MTMLHRYFVYILKCSDQSFYTGVSNNLERRLKEHKEGLNSESYTFSRRPLELIFYEEFREIDRAIEFEKRLKGWSRKKKQALIDSDWEKLKEYAKCLNSTSTVAKGYKGKK